MSLADCNLDYTAPKYFEMTSRSIVRLGDFRFSSNIMQPAGPIQAFSLSLGDFSYHICNMGYSYQEETAKICRSSVLFKKAPVLRSRVGTVGYVSGSLAEALLRDMSFVNVLSLDSMDAIVAVKTSGGDEYSHTKNDPRVTVSLTFGLLSIHACKDSFVCFSGTLGELNAKLTALSAKDIEAMREESSSVPPKATEGSDLNGSANCQLNETNVIFPEESFTSFEATNGHGNSKPMDYMPVKEESEDFIPFLLDGYEWTTIDHDPLPEPKIPDGDEQIAIWYNNTLAISTQIDDPVDRTCGFPARIFHQHFPIQTNIDPLSDGDVGASKYAGEGANVTLKSRLLIHKLTVKLRFFDGYDWPDKLDADQKVAASRQNKTFIIEPEPESARLKRKEDYTEAIKIDGDLAENSHLATKARLLAGLLDNSDEESSTFHAPLPEERAANIERQEELRRLSRKNNLFFQISANGVTLRIDSFEKSDSHRLVSIMSLAIHDLFVAETASLSHPVKMLGEWINENAHPRDTRFGTLMFKVSSLWFASYSRSSLCFISTQNIFL